ncbi:bromodomain-containing protein DDB_G0280777 [Ceratitis capitata]|uniref:bromodomain-containing protein DDB_G0280777 n=1 Tax=Ceratitis capitata TaxID=7213 RepID=UPI00032A0260|nr:bromodomain-containing protein DDB_G0280777 [Ceratitis capitata]
METTHAMWYSCNEEMQLCNDNNGSNPGNNTNNSDANEPNNNDNNNNSSRGNSNCTKNANPTELADSSVTAQVTFNHSKASELRQKRLQRQHEQQHSSQAQAETQSPDISRTKQTPAAAAAAAVTQQSVPVSNLFEKSHSSPSVFGTQRLSRRKRLQRQKPTDLDDADFAYAADLEEEDEDEETELVKQQQQQCVPQHTGATRQPNTRAFGEQCMPHFSHQRTAFDGQPSSLPNSFTTAATITTFQHHQHQHHNHQHQFHHHQQRERRLKHEESFDSSTTTTTNTTDTATSPASPSLRRHHFAMLNRDNSTHSESSSRYSSVDSLLEARKPDPEAILINLGFGPVGSEDILSRIPKRFLKPSQVRGIDTEAFVRRLQLASNLADHSVLGYRGLTGNPDIPPSRIVAKIMQRFEVNERKKSMGSIEQTI